MVGYGALLMIAVILYATGMWRPIYLLGYAMMFGITGE